MVNQRKAGAILNYVSIIINMIVGLIYTPYLLSKLGQSEYGLYSLAASVIAYLTIFDLGFGNAIIRYSAKFKAEGSKEKIENMLGMFLVIYSLISVVVVCIGLILIFNAEPLFGTNMTSTEVEELKILIILLIVNLAFTFPMTIWTSVVTAYERFIFLKSLAISCSIANPLVMVIVLLLGYKAIALVIVTSIFNILTLLIHAWYSKHYLKVNLRFNHFDKSFMKEISIYSFWVFLASLTDQFYWSSGQFILGIVQGTAVVAIFAVALQLKNMYYTFSLAISNVFLPRVTEMITKGVSDKEISELFIRTGRIQFLVISFILSEFLILGQPFICLWAGEEYREAYYVALLLFVSTSIPLIQNLASTILMARNQLKGRSIIVLVVSFVSLLISIPVSQQYGAMGCALTISTAIVVGYGFVLNYYYRERVNLDTIKFWKQIAKMTIVPLFFILVCKLAIPQDYIHSFKELFIIAFVNSVLFIPLIIKFSANEYERDLIFSSIKFVKGKVWKS